MDRWDELVKVDFKRDDLVLASPARVAKLLRSQHRRTLRVVRKLRKQYQHSRNAIEKMGSSMDYALDGWTARIAALDDLEAALDTRRGRGT